MYVKENTLQRQKTWLLYHKIIATERINDHQHKDTTVVNLASDVICDVNTGCLYGLNSVANKMMVEKTSTLLSSFNVASPKETSISLV